MAHEVQRRKRVSDMSVVKLGAGAALLLCALFLAGCSFPSHDTYPGIKRSDGGSMYDVSKGLNEEGDSTGINWRPTDGIYGATVSLFVTSPLGYVFAITQFGIYRSNDEGRTWERRSAGLPPFDRFGAGGITSAIAANTGDLFVATWKYGVYRSGDSGETWTFSGLRDQCIWDIGQNAQGQVFAVTDDGKVFRSSDAARSWSVCYQGGPPLYALVASPAGDIFVGGWWGRIFRSSDQGDTWAEIDRPLPNHRTIVSFAASPDGALFVSDEISVYRSTDRGNTWKNIIIDRSLANYNSVDAIGVAPNGDIFVGGAECLIRSHDSGDSWERISWPLAQDGYVSVYSLGFSKNGSALVGAWQVGVLRVENGGLAMELSSTGLPHQSVSALAVAPGDRVFAATTGGEIYVWSDADGGWRLVRYLGVPIRGLVADSRGGLFAAASIGVYRSSDRGVTWRFLSNCSYPVAVFPGDVVLAKERYYDGLLRSDDFGLSWSLTGAPPGAWSLSANSEGVAFLVTSDGYGSHAFYRSIDTGWTWTRIIEPSTWFPTIQANMDTEDVVGVWDYVYLSADNGDTWNRTPQQAKGYYPSLAFTDNSIFLGYRGSFTGGPGGILASSDGGGTWTEENAGLTNTAVSALAFDAKGYLYAGFMSDPQDSGSWNPDDGGVYRSDEVVIPVKVMIDVKPGSDTNPVGVYDKGVLPVAILGTDRVDVARIDVSTVELAGIAPEQSGAEDIADFNDPKKHHDGYMDLVLKFDVQALLASLGDVASGGSAVLLLQGRLIDGTPIEGSDRITFVK